MLNKTIIYTRRVNRAVSVEFAGRRAKLPLQTDVIAYYNGERKPISKLGGLLFFSPSLLLFFGLNKCTSLRRYLNRFPLLSCKKSHIKGADVHQLLQHNNIDTSL